MCSLFFPLPLFYIIYKDSHWALNIVLKNQNLSLLRKSLDSFNICYAFFKELITDFNTDLSKLEQLIDFYFKSIVNFSTADFLEVLSLRYNHIYL